LRNFKKDIHATPFEYIYNRRLDEAKRLLENSSYSIKEISALVGYENYGAFSEAFKRKFGCPPKFTRGQ
jgi:AraC-like DNA-binding protein